MPAVNPSPFSPCPQFVNATGAPAVGDKLFFYIAGSNTKVDTYTTAAGTTANANPIILDSLGQPSTEIWFTAGQVYKVVWAPSTDTDPPSSPIRTWDNLRGMGDVSVTSVFDQWITYGSAASYISGTSFSVAGNQTDTFQVGRRVKTTNTGGTVYSTIATSVFGAVTTVTLTNDAGTLDSGLSAVAYGVISALNSSIPSASAIRMNTARMLGRTTASIGPVEELTAAQVSAFAAASSETAQGVVELATAAEVRTGTDTGRVPSVSSLRNGAIVSYGQVASTSGSSVDFTSIPSWVKRITVQLDAVSTNGTAAPGVQIGDSDGLETSSYVATVGGGVNTNSITAVTSTGSFPVIAGAAMAAANAMTGVIVLTLMDAATNKWLCNGSIATGGATAGMFTVTGSKSLSGTLDRLSLVTTDTFDAGSVNVLYE